MRRLKKILVSCIAASLVCAALPICAAEMPADAGLVEDVAAVEDSFGTESMEYVPAQAEETGADEAIIDAVDMADSDNDQSDDIDSDDETAGDVFASTGQDAGAEAEGEDVSEIMALSEADALSESDDLQSDDELPEDEDLLESDSETDTLLNFLVVTNPYIEPGESQYIALSIGEEATAVDSAVLSYHRQSDGMVYEVEASRIVGGALLFEIYYPEDCMAAAYELDAVSYVIDGISYTVVFSEIGIDARYGVAMEVETDPDAYLLDEEDEEAAYEIEIGVAAYDENGNQISENSIGEAIAEQQAGIPGTMAATNDAGNIVVVLDPGHDSYHAGAESASGLREQDLTLKIANYCKEELETYAGVEVYMTRTTAACPDGNRTNSECLDYRVNYAADKGAAVFVSIHLNANDDTSISGYQVYYPNANYRPEISEEGYALAKIIGSQLEALGLEYRGIYSLDSQSGDTYEDGSLADYYGVIRRSKLAGFPGIIVEHAFLSNTSDVDTYMSTEEDLKNLGVADAQAIAEYFNLSQTGTDVKKVNGVWTYIVDGKADYTYTGLAKNENGWWYIKDGVVDFTYNGFAENQNGSWYVEDGKVRFDVNNVIKDTTGAIGEKGTWYYVIGSKVQYDFTGLADYKNANGWWYIKDGVVDFTAKGVYKNINGWYYVEGGKVIFSYDGFAENENGSWYIEGGKVRFDQNSVIKDTTGAIGTKGTWYYVVGSKVQYDFTGLAHYKNANGWWYIKDGEVDFTYNGFSANQNGSWYIENGKVRFDKNSVLKDTAGAIGEKGTWYYVVGSKVKYDFTGLAHYRNSNGWWYIKDGVVDFTASGVYKNQNGWYYVEGGKVIFSYDGFAENENGSWYIEGGKVRFDKNSVLKDTAGAIGEKGTWYYVVGSKVQYDFTGLAHYRNSNGWWYIKDGVVDFTFNGIAKNQNGWWFIRDGKVDFSFTGTVTANGTKYSVTNGKVAY